MKPLLQYMKLGVIVAISAIYASPAFANVDVPDELSKLDSQTHAGPLPDKTAFSDENGNIHDLKDFRGTVLLVNLWATWCAPCVKEMPDLNELADKMANKPFRVLAISQDRGGAKDVQTFYKENDIHNLSTALDPKGVMARSFKVRGLPTSILIGRDGNIIGYIEGIAPWTDPAVVDYFTRLTED
ncbi:TlpA disulfide reductase family protein [Thalassospira sp. TSL5-1]|uniref:TlpA disulfide reductase family protein n=1 Tax=Thalassospira sp. TSL5-1 TaxID=1544451 RepID=UPI00093D1E06|nr:TlpA disulfide reductase family protein [Thalassospira sp. TSL5-1]OKH87805.1 thiol:disulfide interchange protein [Thalassospira sp. TSL5-1]